MADGRDEIVLEPVDLLAAGGVAQRRDDMDAVRQRQYAQRDVDGHRLAMGVPAVEVDQLGLLQLAIADTEPFEKRAITRRDVDQGRYIAPEKLVRGVAEHAFGGGIDRLDAAARVDQQDRIGRAVEDGTLARRGFLVFEGEPVIESSAPADQKAEQAGDDGGEDDRAPDDRLVVRDAPCPSALELGHLPIGLALHPADDLSDRIHLPLAQALFQALGRSIGANPVAGFDDHAHLGEFRRDQRLQAIELAVVGISGAQRF
jgi:hypothetical protein